MSTLDPLKMNRKLAPKKKRVTVLISPDSFNALVALHRDRPDFSAGQVVGDALRFALNNGMYTFVTEFDDTVARRKNIEATGNAVRRMADKIGWCHIFGGTEKDGTCSYMKYETTPSGMIVRNQQSQAIKAMPDDYDEFRRTILGGFMSINEAEMMFEEQTKVGAPEDVVKRKKD